MTKPDSLSPNAKILHVDIDPAAISKTVTADIPIVGSVVSVIEEMLQQLQKSKDIVFENILSEYDSKRHFFNPNIRSPDLFRKKLKHRMKQYYSIIYKEK